jgi:hypothetical protein
MPTATPELRQQMMDWFGSYVDDWRPYGFLLSRGYTCDKGVIHPPVPSHTVSQEEGLCIDFLFQEWDYGYDQ